MSHRIRRRMSRSDRRLAGSAVAVGVGLAVLSGHGAAATGGGRAPSRAAEQAIAYAQRQIGLPVPVGRYRSGCVRLFGPGDGGVRAAGRQHRPDE